MGEKPVVTVITLKNPMVMAEIEPYSDAILVEYGVTPQAVVDVLKGAFTPEGLLPVQIPKDMDTVEVEAQSYDYYKKALSDGSYTAYLVFDGNRFIGAGGISY